MTSQYTRSTWGSSIQLNTHTWRIRLKNPEGHLMINTFAYKEGPLLLLIDPGWPWTLDALESALSELELATSLQDVTHYLYTHSHIDHMGSAALLETRSPGAEHFAYKGVEPWLEAWHAYQDRANDWGAWLIDATSGWARSSLLTERDRIREARKTKTMIARFGPMSCHGVHLFDFDDTLTFGQLNLKVIDTRGHDPTHVSFLDTSSNVLYSGDTILAVPTPLSPPMDDDLDLYEESILRLRELAPDALYIGHGTHVEGKQEVQDAIEHSYTFVSQYRTQVLRTLERAKTPLGMWDVALKMTSDGKRFTNAARWWVHVALVDTHIKWWVAQGDLLKIEQGDGPLYQAD